MSYIVKNCPAYQKELVTMDFKTGETKITDKNYCINPFYPNACQDCIDCVMKQVIQECRKSIKCFESNETVCQVCSDAASAELAQDILQLFDIEEINK